MNTATATPYRASRGGTATQRAVPVACEGALSLLNLTQQEITDAGVKRL